MGLLADPRAYLCSSNLNLSPTTCKPAFSYTDQRFFVYKQNWCLKRDHRWDFWEADSLGQFLPLPWNHSMFQRGKAKHLKILPLTPWKTAVRDTIAQYFQGIGHVAYLSGLSFVKIKTSSEWKIHTHCGKADTQKLDIYASESNYKNTTQDWGEKIHFTKTIL